MTIAEKKSRVRDLVRANVLPKNIATELGLHASTVRSVLRSLGYRYALISPAEQQLIRERRLKN